jgi:predicted HAD superfamily Cof-like phosphohydrolase
MNPCLDVKRFHKEAGIRCSDIPSLPPHDERMLRVSLLVEELIEYLEAEKNDDLVEIADGLIDICYIAIGTCIAYGIPFDMVWDEVQKTNMAKLAGGSNIRVDGKIIKPKGWEPPNIKKILDLFKLQNEKPKI